MVLSIVVLAVAGLGAGCATEAAEAPDPGAQGELRLPLVQQTGSGLYRLSASFRVTEPSGAVHVLDASADALDVSLQVSPGINVVELLDGWALSRSLDGGATFAPVSAVLASAPSVNLVVTANERATWSFDFIVRDPFADLHITFGVLEQSRQLAAVLEVDEGFGPFAPYAGAELSFAIFFSGEPQAQIEGDGTHTRETFSFTTALEFFDDPHDQLAALSHDIAGGFLDVALRAHPDGTQDFAGSLQGSTGRFPSLTLEPSDIPFGSVDDGGFPVDQSFFTSGAHVTIQSNDGPLLTGRLRTLIYRPL
jgi:hypothetical protein